MESIVSTGVPGTAAAHLTLRSASGRTSDLTVVWSTRPDGCGCGHAGALVVTWPADWPPSVFDATGCGDWQPVPAQCGCCGGLIAPPAHLYYDEHLCGGALTTAAQAIADEAAAALDAARRAIAAELQADLRRVVAALDARGIAVDEATDDDVAAACDDALVEHGSETDPGIYADDRGMIVAWDFGPPGDDEWVEVTLDEVGG